MGREEATGGGRWGGGAVIGGVGLVSLRFLVAVFVSLVDGAAGFIACVGGTAVPDASARDSCCGAGTFAAVVVVAPTLVDDNACTESFDAAALTADAFPDVLFGAAAAVAAATRLEISAASFAIFSLSSRLLIDFSSLMRQSLHEKSWLLLNTVTSTQFMTCDENE